MIRRDTVAAPSRDIQVKHVNHVVTVVREAPRSIEFYCGLLGFKQIPSMVDNPNITWLQLPSGMMLHLLESQDAPVHPENVHHAFEVEDFDASVKTSQEKGITVERSGVRHDGQRYLFIRDPDGNASNCARHRDFRRDSCAAPKWAPRVP
jgi:catechol 2,3-dioxygenase-like lactoylglutathione lyase family enzyme